MFGCRDRSMKNDDVAAFCALTMKNAGSHAPSAHADCTGSAGGAQFLRVRHISASADENTRGRAPRSRRATSGSHVAAARGIVGTVPAG